jgi:hypothetical protein
MRSWSVIPMVLALASCDDNGGTDDSVRCAPTGTEREIDSAKLFFEYNSTDNDTGIHGAFDSAGWSELCVSAPDGSEFLAVKPRGSFRDFAVGGIFFESREPPASLVPQADVLAMFPPGEYAVAGTTFDGASLVGTANLTHDIPAPVTITAPAADAVVDPANLVVQWSPVTTTVTGAPITITGYEVIVTNEDKDGADPEGMSHPIASIHVVPTVSSLTIPTEFLEPSTNYELELIAIETGGNQTITVQFFSTP